jgi:cell division protein FtsL
MTPAELVAYIAVFGTLFSIILSVLNAIFGANKNTTAQLQKNFDDLRKLFDELKEENEELKLANQKLSEENRCLQLANTALMEENRNFQNANAKLLSKIDGQDKHIAKQARQIKDLQSALRILKLQTKKAL